MPMSVLSRKRKRCGTTPMMVLGLPSTSIVFPMAEWLPRLCSRKVTYSAGDNSQLNWLMPRKAEPYFCESRRVRIGQRLDEHAVNHAENGCRPPMPSASVRTATAVKLRFRRNWRRE